VQSDRYAGTIARILAALPAQGGSPMTPEIAVQIDAILAVEQRQWVSFQFDRLRRFGYGFSMN
jgi:hypothetical protein